MHNESTEESDKHKEQFARRHVEIYKEAQHAPRSHEMVPQHGPKVGREACQRDAKRVRSTSSDAEPREHLVELLA